MKIENILAKFKEIEKGQKTGVYEVEPELIEVARLHTEFFLRRYKKEPERHWRRGEKRTTFVGLVGQKVFDLMLQQFGVPSDRNDPTIDWRLEKRYDYHIPRLGTVETKTFDYWCGKVLIKVSEWHGNDYCVIFQFKDEKPTEVNMMGWLTKEQVEKLQISKKGETKYTPYADAYITDFDKLNPSYDFIEKLRQASLYSA